MADEIRNEIYRDGKAALLKMDVEEARQCFVLSVRKEKHPQAFAYYLYTCLLSGDYHSIARNTGKQGLPEGFELYSLYYFKLMTGEWLELEEILNQMLAGQHYFLRMFALKELSRMGKIPDVAQAIQTHSQYFGLTYEFPFEEQRASLILDSLSGRNQLALLQARVLLKDYPRMGDAYLDFISLILPHCSKDSAEEFFKSETLARIANEDPRVMLELARALYKRGYYEQAGDRLQKLCRLFPHNPMFRYHLANTWLARANYIKAIGEYEETTQLAPLFERAFYNLGICYFRLSDMNRAAQAFQRSLSIKKKPDALYNLSVCLIEKRELQDAYYCLNKIPSQYPAKNPPQLIQNQIREMLILS